ncbi:hypothetical protein CBR_g49019 [Chara braunii]|uniref:RanBD1 domain-containing protein n=1 Tax=Chara braunii TaxID=69332 RepID=A0A388M4C2_CHABU|nr:hypothetical protein CBR_g49019 [Chara braunii]|eukprot:GBG89309.1 hypothetical protein CBR_g49019 [Chara braunii]
MSGKRKANEELCGSSRPSPNMPRWDTGERSLMEIPDSKRSSLCLRHVRALNRDFTSWVQTQSQNHPDELWIEGLQDYIKYAAKLMDDFKDVVEWLRSKPNPGSRSVNGEAEPNGIVLSSAERGVSAVTAVGEISQNQRVAGGMAAMGTVSSSALSIDVIGGSAMGGPPVPNAAAHSSCSPAGLGGTLAPGTGTSTAATVSENLGPGPLTDTKAVLGHGFGGSLATAPSDLLRREPGAGVGAGAESGPWEQAGPLAGYQKGPTVDYGGQSAAGRPSDSTKTSVSGAPTSQTAVNHPIFGKGWSSGPGSSEFGRASGSGAGLVANAATGSSFSSTFGLSTSWPLSSMPANSIGDTATIFGMPPSSHSDGNVLTSVISGAASPVAPVSPNSASVSPFRSAFKTGPFIATAGPSKEEAPKEQGDDDNDDGTEEQEDEGPSVLAVKEEGVTIVDSRKAVLLRMDGVSKSWRNLGSGTLSIRRQSDATPATKSANPTMHFRNDVGKLLLNARIYARIKTATRKEGVVVTLFNAADIGSVTKASGSQGDSSRGDSKLQEGNGQLKATLFLLKVVPQEAVKELADLICANAPAD